jgi:hypothetical protein
MTPPNVGFDAGGDCGVETAGFDEGDEFSAVSLLGGGSGETRSAAFRLM